jgi:hypothetical protein
MDCSRRAIATAASGLRSGEGAGTFTNHQLYTGPPAGEYLVVREPVPPPIAFDENGWAVGQVAPLPRDTAFTLFTSETSAAFDISALAARGRDHGVALALEPEKSYRRGTPLADAGWLEVGSSRSTQRILVLSVPAERARAIVSEALSVARTVGGGGMDALVSRARRVWQVDATRDIAAATAVAAALSALRSAAIFPPDGGALFGPKTAWERYAP